MPRHLGKAFRYTVSNNGSNNVRHQDGLCIQLRRNRPSSSSNSHSNHLSSRKHKHNRSSSTTH